MHNLLRLLAVALAMTTLTAFADRNLAPVIIDANFHSTPVSVTGSPAMVNNLANFAFNADGAFRRVVPSAAAYAINFTEVGSAQVQVTVTRGGGGGSVLSQVVTGTSTRNALFRAADLAVKAITGKDGFFSDRLTFISNYSGHSEVFTSDLFFGDVRQITHDRAQAITPRWSPDGRNILYTSYRSGYPNIYLIDLARQQRTVFAQFKGTNSGARFSPDGSQVAMVLSGTGVPEIYVSNAQGRQVAQRTYSHAVQASPCWSPDGSRLVFTSDAAGAPQLYVMPSAGGMARRLPTMISRYCAEPDWSRSNPDLIAFTAGVGHGYQIAVYDLSGKTQTRIVSKAPADALNPAWLGDGRHLIYTARSAGSRSLYILDTETGKSTRISPPSMREVSQANVWSPSR